jgi:hypothetical protein
MENFLTTSFTFPAVLYSGLLAIVTIYWLFSIIGFFDLDVLDLDVEAEGEGNVSVLSHFLSKFKLDGVPVTISLSLIILFSWGVSFFISYEFSQKITEEWLRVVLGFWVLILAPFLTAPLVAVIIRPLKPLFRPQKEQSAKDIVGKIATVRSSKVTATFGEASFNDGGAGLILKIRSEENNQLESPLKRGDKVLLKHYNATQNTYVVVVAK